MVDACILLWRKGILTISSSANLEQGSGVAHILVDFESLSERNKAIATKIPSVKQIGSWGGIGFYRPISSNDSIRDVEEWGINIANYFEPQFAAWVNKFNEKELKTVYDLPDEADSKRIVQEWGFFLGDDGYYYLSEDDYNKYHGKQLSR